MEKLYLFMVMIGCKPNGRLTEQHDIFFGIADSISSLKPQIDRFWPEAIAKWHIDAWRTISYVDGHSVEVVNKPAQNSGKHLYFINLGGYRPAEFDEYHYKILCIATSMDEAIKKSKQTAFYKHFGFKGAVSHLDDKYGIDLDDAAKVVDVLSPDLKNTFSLKIEECGNGKADDLHIGYLKLKTTP